MGRERLARHSGGPVKISASPDRFTEDVRVLAVVVAELELGDVERQILVGYLMEGADHAALHERPETFDGLSVDGADNVLADCMVNRRVGIFGVEFIVASPLIGAKQADLRRDRLADEFGEGRGADVLDDARDNIAFAANRANHDGFARADAASSTAAPAFIPMPVLGLSAYESLVHFNNAHELAEIFVRQPTPDTHAHVPSRPVRAEAKHPMDLKGADPFLAGEHQVDHAEPIAERLIGVLEDCSDDMRKPMAAAVGIARIAFPIPGHRSACGDVHVAAARARNPIRPAVRDQVGTARIFVGEGRFPLRDGHLVDLFFGLTHGPDPRDLEAILRSRSRKVKHNRLNLLSRLRCS
jgi:hypothetical protein